MRQGGTEDGDGPVERHDDGDHAQGLIAHRRTRRDVARDRLEHLGGVDLVRVHQRQVPADLQHERVDPALETDLAVLLRQDRAIFGSKGIRRVGHAHDGGLHHLGALLRRQGGPGRIGGLGGGDGVADVLRGGGGGMADDDARLGRIGDRHLLGGLALRAPDVQCGRNRIRHVNGPLLSLVGSNSP